MPWIIAGGALVGGYLAGEASKDAAGESAKGSRYAADLEQKRYEQSREDQMPWMRSGRESLSQMNRMMGLSYYDYSKPVEGGEEGEFQLFRPGEAGYEPGDFKKTPGYQFRLDEGLRALQRSAGSVTGNTLKGMMEHGQNYAFGEYQNQYNRLANMAGQGQVSTQGIGQLGAASAARQGGYAQAGANARASGYLGQSQAIGGTLGNLASIYRSSGSGGGGYGGGGAGGAGGGGYGGGYVAPGGSFAPSTMYQAPDYGGNY